MIKDKPVTGCYCSYCSKIRKEEATGAEQSFSTVTIISTVSIETEGHK